MNTIVERGTGVLHRLDALLASIPPSLALLMLRVALAVPFFRSGLTKWEGFLNLSPSAHYLFANEFKLHLFGQAYGFPLPTLAAWGSSLGEIVLPVLLVAGLFTRFAAFGLLLMTAVIQLTIPDGWANFHLPWAAMALALVVYGGGRVSADALLPAGR
ncbi:MAG: DoxX family protein [Aquamicrobium sp.]|nr:DoxX family protein [Aquamicrobium sp.]